MSERGGCGEGPARREDEEGLVRKAREAGKRRAKGACSLGGRVGEALGSQKA